MEKRREYHALEHKNKGVTDELSSTKSKAAGMNLFLDLEGHQKFLNVATNQELTTRNK